MCPASAPLSDADDVAEAVLELEEEGVELFGLALDDDAGDGIFACAGAATCGATSVATGSPQTQSPSSPSGLILARRGFFFLAGVAGRTTSPSSSASVRLQSWVLAPWPARYGDLRSNV